MECRITFLPDGKSADVTAGGTVVQAAVAAGVRLIAPCNGKGTCGKCGVQFQEGAPAPQACDDRFYGSVELTQGWRLACAHKVATNAVVFAAPATLGKVDFGPSMAGVVLNPAVRKVHIRLDSLRGDNPVWADLQQGAEEGLEAQPTLSVLRKLPGLRFLPGLELTAVVRQGRVVALEEGDTRLETFGLALDIGTTTVAASLVDLSTGDEVARASALNRQAVHGSDVMSRLTSLAESPGLFPELQRLAVETAAELLDGMLVTAGVGRERIYDITIVGNSCMHHVFLGIDPTPLGIAPYDALVTGPLAGTAGDAGIAGGLGIDPETPIYALPTVASFIGGDALAATLAVGLHRSERITCLVDIGTNGEIVLGSKDRIIACSTPAGPAFEGASISCGMIASEGAAVRVTLGDAIVLETVGGGKPRGLAGSGLIDLVAELRRVGLLSVQGRYVLPAKVPGLPAPLAEHALDGEGFVVAKTYGKKICLTQRDVRELQLAKGVIFAGIEALRIEMGIEHDAIGELYLAGTFGSFVDIPNARLIGLVPPLPTERIRAVGNAAMVGAKMCLLSLEARAEAEALAGRIEHVELPKRKDFQDIFMDAMLFPTVDSREAPHG